MSKWKSFKTILGTETRDRQADWLSLWPACITRMYARGHTGQTPAGAGDSEVFRR